MRPVNNIGANGKHSVQYSVPHTDFYTGHLSWAPWKPGGTRGEHAFEKIAPGTLGFLIDFLKPFYEALRELYL